MSIPGAANPLLLRTAAAGGYNVERSLRFNSSDSAYLSRTPASAGNRKTWTWAGWVKRSALGGTQMLFDGAPEQQYCIIWFVNDALYFDNYNTSAAYSSAVFRDTSAWMHVVVSVDTTNATANDRIRLYVNNSRLATSSYLAPTLNENLYVNQTKAHRIGSFGFTNTHFFSGYLADIHFIDGQALDPTSFTEVSATTGQLIPKAYTGSFGTNGFWLKFSDNSAATATTLGKDYSGNSNNWTPNNLSVTAGAGNDSLVDTPTSYGTDTGAGGEVRGNYCTWNPLQSIYKVQNLSDGNLTNTGADSSSIGTIGIPPSGKWYVEVSVSGSGGVKGAAGICDASGNKQVVLIPTGNVLIGIAVDRDAGEVKLYANNVIQSTTSLSTAGYSANETVCIQGYVGTPYAGPTTLNAGQRPFAYTAPSGFKALCDTNLPAPVVAKPNTVMDVKTYTGSGNGTAVTVSGLNFQTDLLWIKCRSSGDAARDYHALWDSVRGANKLLYSNRTDAETSFGADQVAFNSSDFIVGPLPGINDDISVKTYVGWCWDAGSSTVTNTQGSITSSCRTNQSSGFSIVSFTVPSNGTDFSVGHGLGVAPSLIITKGRGASDNWVVFHSSVVTSTSQYLRLNTTDSLLSTTNIWGTSLPTSTVFSGRSGNLLVASQAAIAYCFSPVAGYSSMSSFVGNGSADGPAVYTGFRPRWILFKDTTSIVNWAIIDAARNSYNVANNRLYANDSAAEDPLAGSGVDILSNGFKLRTTDGHFNKSGATYIYAAFAESPFQYARAR